MFSDFLIYQKCLISMLSNLAETLHSSAKKKKKHVVSNSKNKNLVTQCGFQKVWKIPADTSLPERFKVSHWWKFYLSKRNPLQDLLFDNIPKRFLTRFFYSS